MLIDTHCHLNFEAFDNDYKEVITHSLNYGMKLINVGSQFETSQKAVQITKEFPRDVYAAVGLHPIHVIDEEFNYKAYKALAFDEKVVGIGETGLDYYRLYADSDEEERQVKDKQAEIFKEHLNLARELNKPVILHSRDAYREMREILKEQGNLKGVVHCYLGNRKLMKEFLDLGLLISFTGIITYTDDQELLAVVKEAPLEKIMIETDSPYLTPPPDRDGRNVPMNVEKVAYKIATIKGIPHEEVIEKTTKTAIEFFGLK